jgi:hypothetical protein
VYVSRPGYYFNSGLVAGEFARDRALLRRWHDAMQCVLQPPAHIYDDPDLTGRLRRFKRRFAA